MFIHYFSLRGASADAIPNIGLVLGANSTYIVGQPPIHGGGE